MTASAVSQKLSPEEREILDQFERRALHPVADVEYELEMARQAPETRSRRRRIPATTSHRARGAAS